MNRSDGHSAVWEGRTRVAVKSDHDSNGQVRWSSNPVADGLYSSHCSVDKANINPEVTVEHYTGRSSQATSELSPLTYT